MTRGTDYDNIDGPPLTGSFLRKATTFFNVTERPIGREGRRQLKRSVRSSIGDAQSAVTRRASSEWSLWCALFPRLGANARAMQVKQSLWMPLTTERGAGTGDAYRTRS